MLISLSVALRKQRLHEVDRPAQQIADQVHRIEDLEVLVLAENLEQLILRRFGSEQLDEQIAKAAEAGQNQCFLCFGRLRFPFLCQE